MKLPKYFFYFLGVTQTVLILGHWLLYSALLFFFPQTQSYQHLLLAILAVLSVSFFAISILGRNSENIFFRIVYIFSAVWMVTWFYLLCAAAVCSVIYLLTGNSSEIIAGSVFGVMLLFSLYGVINARLARTTHVTISLPNLPEFWQGKTAVMLSDLHLGHVLKKGFANKLIKKINSMEPEIVFIPGDFFDGVKTDFTGLANEFKKIKAPSGIYYCSGNHEQMAGMRACENAIEQAGIRVLENQKEEVSGLQIIGTSYQHETTGSLKEILESLKIDKNRPSVYLKHLPNHLEAAEAVGISLQLSGHTHHGQIFPGRYFTRKIFKGYDYGLKTFGKLQVYTSSGVGTWGPPMRTFTKSEIVKITFR